MHTATPQQPVTHVTPATTPAAIAERIAAIDQRVSAIDLELLTLRESIAAITCLLQHGVEQSDTLLHPVSRPIIPRE